MNKTLLPLKPLIQFAAVLLLSCSASRILLGLWNFSRVQESDNFLQILINGLRIDLSLLAQVALLPLLLILVACWIPRLQGVVGMLIRSWLVLAALLVIFLEVATPLFIDQFDIRPNRLFIEYLNSPAEITGMLVNGFLLESIVILGATLGIGILAVGFISKMPAIPKLSYVQKTGVTLSLVALLVVDILVGRSGLQHRPINPAMVAVSNDRLVNSLALNSAYSLLYAAYQYGNEYATSYAYGELPQDWMLNLVKSRMDADIAFTGQGDDSLHFPVPSVPAGTVKKDLVIVVEESLGAAFVQSLGGKPVTPSLEAWRQKSWWFDNLYATGIRSARGLEAITTGFLPTTSRAVLKLPRAQSEFFTLASYLKQAGYESTFIYGGESHFDNMKGFFLSNGFDRVIDQYDYDNPEFKGSWGVSDEDLFERALAFIDTPRDKPRFILIFSSSNHPPYEFPDGKIELFDPQRKTAVNAAKYSDFALGTFLDRLSLDGRLEQTTLLVVADHEDSVFGSKAVPYEKYHIPGFILDPDVGPSRIDPRLVSQIDLAPTLISLLGIDLPNPMIGHDLTKSTSPFTGRAIMQFGSNQAYMTEDCIVYLQPGQAPVLECQNGDVATNSALVEVALAHAQFAEYAYRNEKYSSRKSVARLTQVRQ